MLINVFIGVYVYDVGEICVGGVLVNFVVLCEVEVVGI